MLITGQDSYNDEAVHLDASGRLDGEGCGITETRRSHGSTEGLSLWFRAFRASVIQTLRSVIPVFSVRQSFTAYRSSVSEDEQALTYWTCSHLPRR